MNVKAHHHSKLCSHTLAGKAAWLRWVVQEVQAEYQLHEDLRLDLRNTGKKPHQRKGKKGRQIPHWTHRQDCGTKTSVPYRCPPCENENSAGMWGSAPGGSCCRSVSKEGSIFTGFGCMSIQEWQHVLAAMPSLQGRRMVLHSHHLMTLRLHTWSVGRGRTGPLAS